MKKRVALFLIGLIMFVSGVYLSIHWIVLGTFLGVCGGLIMGWSTPYLAEKR